MVATVAKGLRPFETFDAGMHLIGAAKQQGAADKSQHAGVVHDDIPRK
jgi:hypothetical protein